MRLKKTAILLSGAVLLYGDAVTCEIQDERIYCTYTLVRSDCQNEKQVEFHWISPRSPEDDRIRHFKIPPGYGSVYDYRFVPGRVTGRWRVRVTDLESNATAETFFDLNSSDDSIFEE